MEAFFLVVHVLLAISLIGIVLIQRSSTDGFGLGSGSGSNFMSGRQTANLLTRATAIIATLFMINCLWLGWISTHQTKVSLADEVQAASEAKASAKSDAKADKTDAKSDESSEVKKKVDEKTGDATKKEPASNATELKKKPATADKASPATEEAPAKAKTSDAPSVPVAQ